MNIRNQELNEQLALINQLDDDEKNALIKIINSMLTKKRMKDLLDGKIKLALSSSRSKTTLFSSYSIAKLTAHTMSS
ncbi:MAG: hypothetical protein AB2L20_24340 [Mangrovibacterium sp.]